MWNSVLISLADANILKVKVVSPFFEANSFKQQHFPFFCPNLLQKSAQVNRRYWSNREVNALKEGVKRHGVGRWIYILRDPDIGPRLQGACTVGRPLVFKQNLQTVAIIMGIDLFLQLVVSKPYCCMFFLLYPVNTRADQHQFERQMEVS